MYLLFFLHQVNREYILPPSRGGMGKAFGIPVPNM